MKSDVLSGESLWSVEKSDAIAFLNALEPGSLSMVFGSPPYEKARLYLEDGEDLSIARDTEQWVAWMVDVTRAALRATNGLVAWVVEGQTKDYRYSCGPALLMADLHRAGVCLRKPPIYRRVGIPGSGGPDWLRNDYEFVVCCTNGGKLPWSDNTAMGHPPKWAPGGKLSYRDAEGKRRHKIRGTSGYSGGDARDFRASEGRLLDRAVTEIANPGNVVDCLNGGGHLGNDLAHENEAPFSEKLVEFFVRSFAKEGSIVCDPFSGSGTTGAVCLKWGRKFVGCDLRQSQVDLTTRRLKGEKTLWTC